MHRQNYRHEGNQQLKYLNKPAVFRSAITESYFTQPLDHFDAENQVFMKISFNLKSIN